MRDNLGFMLSACSKQIGYWSVLFAELWGIRICLEWAWNQGYRDLIVETDSLLAHQIVANHQVRKVTNVL